MKYHWVIYNGERYRMFLFHQSDSITKRNDSGNTDLNDETMEWIVTNLVETPRIIPTFTTVGVSISNERDIVVFQMFFC